MSLRIQDLSDASFDVIGNRPFKGVLRYNHSLGKFELYHIDTVLGIATDAPTDFSNVLSGELNINNITNNIIDGGVF